MCRACSQTASGVESLEYTGSLPCRNKSSQRVHRPFRSPCALLSSVVRGLFLSPGSLRFEWNTAVSLFRSEVKPGESSDLRATRSSRRDKETPPNSNKETLLDDLPVTTRPGPVESECQLVEQREFLFGNDNRLPHSTRNVTAVRFLKRDHA